MDLAQLQLMDCDSLQLHSPKQQVDMLTRPLPLLRGLQLCVWVWGARCYAHDDERSLVVSVESPYCCHTNCYVDVLSSFTCTSIVVKM